MQLKAPELLLYLPGRQAVQALWLMLLKVDLPSTHSSHVVRPSSALYLPPGQRVHSMPVPYLPATHPLQEVRSAEEKVLPSGQAVHSVAAAVALYLPALQSVQLCVLQGE